MFWTIVESALMAAAFAMTFVFGWAVGWNQRRTLEREYRRRRYASS